VRVACAFEAAIKVHLGGDAAIGSPLAVVAAKLLAALAHIQ
jgi:hypothetical protein